MTTALKELPKLVVPSGLLGRVATVNAAIEKATREVLVSLVRPTLKKRVWGNCVKKVGPVECVN